MFSTLLVPLDGSEFSEGALPLARTLAAELGSELHLVHVARPAPDTAFRTPQDDMDWSARVREGAESYLADVSERMSQAGAAVRTAVLEGSVVDALDQYMTGHRISLVVMTTHGAGGIRRWWLGSVADRLLRAGGASVLLVRPWDDTQDRAATEPRFRHLLVPLDGSETAEAALPVAVELSRAFESRLTLQQVVPTPVELTSIYGVPGVRMEGDAHRERVERARSYLAGLAPGVEKLSGTSPGLSVVEEREAAEGVIEGAKKAGADLIVLASHGRGGLARFTLGSVADKIVRGTVLPVLVIRPPAVD
jgi:nucleotide-binding universal stress UspA family protein